MFLRCLHREGAYIVLSFAQVSCSSSTNNSINKDLPRYPSASHGRHITLSKSCPSQDIGHRIIQLNMFFDVGDGEGGTVADRVAIVAIVCFAFSWIPVMVIWKIVSVCRSDNTDVEHGNAPVTTRASAPREHPQPAVSPVPVVDQDTLAQQQPQQNQFAVNSYDDEPQYQEEEDLAIPMQDDAGYHISVPADFPSMRVGPEKGYVESSDRRRPDDRHFDGFSFEPAPDSGAFNGLQASQYPYPESPSQYASSSRRQQSTSRRDRDGFNHDDIEQSYQPPLPGSHHNGGTSRSHRSRRAERDMEDHYPTEPLRIHQASSRHRSRRLHDDPHPYHQDGDVYEENFV